MKTFSVLIILAASNWVFSGCSGTQATADEEVATYQCPSCKETVSWKKGAFWKPGLLSTRQRVVTHTCPSCQKEWSSNLAVDTTCEVCQDQHLECPICQKHGTSG